jgi:Septum formation
MTDPFSPGGAGLPDPQINPADPGQPATPPEMPPADPAPADGGAGFGMPSGQGFGAPTSSIFDNPPAGSPPAAPVNAQPEGWTPGPALKPTSGRPRYGRRRLIIIVGIIAVIVIASFVLKDRLTGAPGELGVGDCFDVPTAEANDIVSEIQHHPCTEAHTAEIFLIADYPGTSDTYPSSSDFDAFANTSCTAAFTTYVGSDINSNPDLDAGYFYPPEEGWTGGDRRILCYVERTDGGTMTKSLKGGGGAAASPTP